MVSHRVSHYFPRQRQVWLLLVASLAAAGCGKPGQLTGKVSYNGKLLPTGRVVFFNSKDRQVGSASISKDGTYSATVPSGSLRVAVITPPPTTLKTMSKDQAKQVTEGIKKMKKGAFNPLEGESADSIPEKVIAVPPKFADPDSSGVVIEVIGGPQSFDIDLR